MASRIKLGDIVEVKTSIGYAYLQYTHKHPEDGALVRVFKGVYKNKLKDFQTLRDKEIQFVTFFPLQRAVNLEIVQVVGNIKVREDLKEFPLFKSMLGHDVKTNKALSWNLWDGEKIIGKIKPPLTQEQKKLPVSGIINDTLLIERIESGWTSEKDPRL